MGQFGGECQTKEESTARVSKDRMLFFRDRLS